VRRDDTVVTNGGLVGRVTKAADDQPEIEVEIAPNIRVTVMRDTITSVIRPVVANDPKPPAKKKAS
jgi:preprotein translocase subunit YajC